MNSNNVKIVSADTAYSQVTSASGATEPVRDSVDTRIIKNVTSQVSFFPNLTSQAGGYPSGAITSSVKDTDRDGIADDWEVSHGLNPNSASDGSGDINSDGYTNIEDYLNDIAGTPSWKAPSTTPTSTTTSSNSITNGLVGYWKLDSLSGTTLSDSSGKNKNGVLKYDATVVSGKVGNALQLGKLGYVTVGDLGISQNGPVTIAGWVRFSKLAKDSGEGKSRDLLGSIYQHYANNYIYLSPTNDYFTTNWQTNQWYHIAVTYNGNSQTAKLYVNGTLVSVKINSGAENISSLSNFGIGEAGGEQAFDEVRVYNRVLSESEIKSLYNYR